MSSFDLLQVKSQIKNSPQHIKIEITEGLQFLCKIFGTSLAVGVREKFQNYVNLWRAVDLAAKFNILDIQEETRDIVILRHEYGASKLNVSV